MSKRIPNKSNLSKNQTPEGTYGQVKIQELSRLVCQTALDLSLDSKTSYEKARSRLDLGDAIASAFAIAYGETNAWEMLEGMAAGIRKRYEVNKQTEREKMWSRQPAKKDRY